VLVVLNKESSLSFKTYAPNDFAEIGCSKVTELTKELSASAKRQYDSKTSQSQNIGRTDTTSNNELIKNVDKFRAILRLDLAEGGKENVLSAIKQLEEREDVLSAEPNYTMFMGATPNDPYLGQQWAINNTNLPNAWNVTTGSSTITVGVLDSGIDGTHPDLTNRINKSLCRDFTSGQMVVVPNPTDPKGHGTHVAGILGAQGNNGIGVAGTCWDVKMVSLRVLDANGNGYIANLILAIDFGCSQGIQLFNASLYSYTQNLAPALEQTIKSYYALFVCCAGNDKKDNDVAKAFPASFRLPNVISVGAITSGNVCDPNYSNWGQTTVDLFAPGSNIYSTSPGGQYVYKDGTSMATAFVTGVAALLLTKNKCSPFALKTLIMNNVDKLSALSTKCVSGGKLNAQNAINANLFGGGDGTSGAPYQISTAQHLKDIENFSTSNAYYKVMSNITLSGSWMTTIDPTQSNILFGTFDGNGKTISGLSITSPSSGYFGLFHETRGTVKNLTMSGVNINKTFPFNNIALVGAISGYNAGTIDNCTVNGSITASGSVLYVGGVAGYNSGTIKNSANYADVTSNNTLYNGLEIGATGGIAGYCDSGTISGCNDYGTITGNDRTGGIVGYSYLSTVSTCRTSNGVTKNVNISWKTINAKNSAGGIAGETYYGSVTDCYFINGQVKYTSPGSSSTSLQPNLGRIIGYSYKTTFTSNSGGGSVDKGTLQMVGSFNQALYAAQYGLCGQQIV